MADASTIYINLPGVLKNLSDFNVSVCGVVTPKIKFGECLDEKKRGKRARNYTVKLVSRAKKVQFCEPKWDGNGRQLTAPTYVHVCSSLFRKQTTRGSRSVGAFRAPPLPPAPVWHLLGPFKTWGFKGLGCSRPPWPQALRKRYLRVQIRSTRLRSQISESESEGQNQCMQNR